MGIGLPEIAIILVVVAVLFGARRLPELGRGLGSGMREFKDGIQGKDDEPSVIDPPAAQSAQVVTPPQPAEPATPAAPAPAEQPAPPHTEQ